MRDITLGDTFRHQFTTRAFATGIPTVLTGTPVLSVLEENNVTPITAGVSVLVDRASVVGLNEATIIATGGNGYEVGKSYCIYISTGTVGGVSVVGEVVGNFTVELAAVHIRLGAPAGASVSADIADLPTVAEFNARTLVAASYFDPATDAVANVTLVATVTTLTGHTAQTGDSFVRLGAPAGASVSVDIADLPTVAEFNARTLLAASYFDPATDTVANVTLVATTTTNTDMRGTDGAALAAVLGALADVAADGDPTAVDTIMQYVKQLINTLVGTVGIPVFPASAAPANGVSLAEVLRAVFDDTNEIGTAGAGLTALPISPANVTQWNAAAVAVPSIAGVPEVDITHQVGTLVPAPATAGIPDVNTVEILDTAVSISGGDLDVNVAAMAAGTITAAAIATGAVDADSLAADAVDKIRDGLLPTSNAAFNNIEFLFVAASDHVTPVTGATGVSGTRSIDGAAFGAVTGTIAEVGNGIYQFDASAADMNGGIITFRFIATGGTPGAPDDRFLTIVTGAGV